VPGQRRVAKHRSKEHGIEGGCWFDPDSNDAAYFGDDLKLAMQEGLSDYLVDFADRLNFQRLNCPLIYEHLDRRGIDSASGTRTQARFQCRGYTVKIQSYRIQSLGTKELHDES
jgi:hypothetical protein